MDTGVLTALSNLESKLSALLTSITSSPTAAGAPTATVALLDADAALSRALDTLRTHQTNYTRILRLRAQARGLEERVRGIVREIGGIGDEISASANDDGESSDDSMSDDSDLESESDAQGEDVRMAMGDGGNVRAQERRQRKHRIKEVDYKLLLDFARRISKYNVQAAADAGKRPEKTEREPQPKDPGLAAATQEATSWLNETANMVRDESLLPFPTEDRIRMGLMGRIQAAVVERGGDIEEEVERLVLTDGAGTIGPSALDQKPGDTSEVAGGSPAPAAAISATAVPGVGVRTAGGPPAPPQRPKAKLDLDLYDPDDDEL
jgi:hypothetical protein